MRKPHVLLLSLLIMPLVSATEPEIAPGKIVDGVPTGDNPNHTYALYLPSNYDDSRTWPLLLLFDPSARGIIPMQQFAAAAEAHGFIVAASNRTRNYVGWEFNAPAVRDFWKDVTTRFSVNPKLVFGGGFSGGARLTTRVATTTQGFAGVMLCGAGFHVQSLDQVKVNFPVAVTIGTLDMNWLEVHALEQAMVAQDITHRLLPWDGPHWWPPETVCHDVLGWFLLTAVQRGLISREAANLDTYLAWRQTRAREAYDAGEVALGVAMDRQIQRDFAGMVDLSEVEKRLAEFASDPAIEADREARAAAEQMESLYRRDMLRRMAMGEDQPPVGPVATNRELKWWKDLHLRLNKRLASDPSTREEQAVKRLFEMSTSLIYEKLVYAVRRQNWDGVMYLAEVALTMKSDLPYPHLFKAIVHAHQARNDLAFEALEKFLTMTGRPGSSLADEKRLAPLFDDPRWQTLVK